MDGGFQQSNVGASGSSSGNFMSIGGSAVDNCFDLGFNFGDASTATRLDSNLQNPTGNMETCVDSLFSVSPRAKSAQNDVCVMNDAPTHIAGPGNIVTSVKGDKDMRIAELEAVLEEAREKILRLECDLEVKDTTKDAERDVANMQFREAAQDTNF